MSVSETVMRMVEPYHTSAQITAASATQSSASSRWLRFQSRRSPLALRPADGQLQLLRGLLRRAEGGRYLLERALPAQGVPYLVGQAVREPPPGGAARRQRA